jgi:predicted outer membrane protein
VIVSEAEKATECQDGVGHLTSHLVDHDAFDRTDLLVVCAGIAPKTEDFIKEAAMSGMVEIDAAKIAQQKRTQLLQAK